MFLWHVAFVGVLEAAGRIGSEFWRGKVTWCVSSGDDFWSVQVTSFVIAGDEFRKCWVTSIGILQVTSFGVEKPE